jgi:C-terminal processing protease CtpA/Prc
VSLTKRGEEVSGKSAREVAFEVQHNLDSAAIRKGLKAFLLSPETPLVAALKVTGNRKIAYGELPGKIAYVVPITMGGYTPELTEADGANAHAKGAAAVLDALFAEFQQYRAIIIDLRFNQGGFDSVALAWAARIATQQTLALRKRAGKADWTAVSVTPSAKQGFHGPVAVLVGNYTVSAGETAAQALMALPNVMSIGQPTQGALSDAIPKVLPNGWRFTLSIESYATPDGTDLELRGVVPTHLSDSGKRTTPAATYGAEIAQAMTLLKSQIDEHANKLNP